MQVRDEGEREGGEGRITVTWGGLCFKQLLLVHRMIKTSDETKTLFNWFSLCTHPPRNKHVCWSTLHESIVSHPVPLN